MLSVTLLRNAWLGLLAVMPVSLLARLDGWSRRQAERRAAKRLRALRQARG